MFLRLFDAIIPFSSYRQKMLVFDHEGFMWQKNELFEVLTKNRRFSTNSEVIENFTFGSLGSIRFNKSYLTLLTFNKDCLKETRTEIANLHSFAACDTYILIDRDWGWSWGFGLGVGEVVFGVVG